MDVLGWQDASDTSDTAKKQKTIEPLPADDRKRVTRWNHCATSALEGAVVMRAHWLASKGMRSFEIVDALNNWVAQPSTFQVGYFDSIGFTRAGGRLKNYERGYLGSCITRRILDCYEYRDFAMALKSDFISRDREPGREEVAKLTPLGMGQVKDMRGMLGPTLVDMARDSGHSGEWDLLVSCAARPQMLQPVVLELKERLSIRNIYYSDVSNLMTAQVGPANMWYMMWPADDMDFRAVSKESVAGPPSNPNES